MATKGAKKGKQAAKKRSATATEIKKEREQQNAQPTTDGGQLKAILLFALAVLMLFLVIIEGKSLWNMLHSFLFGLFGISVYLLPFFLGFVAIVSAMGKMSSAVTVKTVEACGLFKCGNRRFFRASDKPRLWRASFCGV